MCLGIAIAVNGGPDQMLASASSVEVHERMGEQTTYRLRYPVDISEGDLPSLTEVKFDPSSELSVLIPVDGNVHCLVKGPVNSQQVHLEHGGAGSWLDVNGTDTSAQMDRETRAVVWSDATDSEIASSIISNYGYVPDVDSTTSRHLVAKHSLVQRDTDLGFVRRLARRNGCLFWVTCDAGSIETAHFARPKLIGHAASELVINMSVPSLDTIDFTWDIERPTAVVGSQLDLNTLNGIDGSVPDSSQRALGAADLSDIAGPVRTVHLAAPADDAGDLQARGKGVLAESDWFLRATCGTTLEAMGGLVRAHSLIELSGAGSRYSGRYYVSAVQHIIDASQHRMDIELVRNAWGG